MNKYIFAILVLAVGLCSCDRNVFWHMSDIHMQADYYKGSDPNKRCVSGTGKAGRFGDYNCRSPYDIELSVVNSFNQLYTKKKPSFILYTGDFGADYKGAHTEETSTMYLKNVTGVLTMAQDLTGARIFPVNIKITQKKIHYSSLILASWQPRCKPRAQLRPRERLALRSCRKPLECKHKKH